MNDIKIENVLGLEAPLVKLMDITSRGIGKLYEPRYQKRMAKAEVEKIKRLSKAIEENLLFPIKYSSEELLIDTTSVEELAKRAQGRLFYQEMKKQNNIENTLDKTYNILKDKESVPDEKVSDDWILRFFNSIEDISNEKMQEIWAKILAGEILQPKSISLRTLEKLRNISSEEALVFQKICKFALQSSRNTVFLPHQDEWMKKTNYEFSDILLLEECGLISANGFITVNLPFSESKENVSGLYNNEIIGIIKSEKESKLRINAYTFTNSGVELYKTIASFESNNEYFLEYLRELNKKEGYEIKAHKIVVFEKEGLRYDDTINLL